MNEEKVLLFWLFRYSYQEERFLKEEGGKVVAGKVDKTLVVGIGSFGQNHYDLMGEAFEKAGFDLEVLKEGDTSFECFCAADWVGGAFVRRDGDKIWIEGRSSTLSSGIPDEVKTLILKKIHGDQGPWLDS